jgi:hypothetical protein
MPKRRTKSLVIFLHYSPKRAALPFQSASYQFGILKLANDIMRKQPLLILVHGFSPDTV